MLFGFRIVFLCSELECQMLKNHDKRERDRDIE